MNSRPSAGRFFAVIGSALLLASAALHCVAYVKISSPAVAASNLSPALKAVFDVAFLSMAWNWVVLAAIVLVVTFAETRARKPLVLLCGFAVLIQGALTVPFVGFFIGNEMIGAAAILIIIGGFSFHQPIAVAPVA